MSSPPSSRGDPLIHLVAGLATWGLAGFVAPTITLMCLVRVFLASALWLVLWVLSLTAVDRLMNYMRQHAMDWTMTQCANPRNPAAC